MHDRLDMSGITISKDSKGPTYIISHVRCGVTECLFLTLDELLDLSKEIRRTFEGLGDDSGR